MDINELTYGVVSAVRSELRDLSQRQLAMLLLITTSQKQTVRGLAVALTCGKPAITRNANSLQKLGLIKREKVKNDGRDVRLVPTDAGHEYIDAYLTILNSGQHVVRIAA